MDRCVRAAGHVALHPVTLSLGPLDEAAVCALAGQIGATLAPGDVVALFGDLGAGKTTFARALIRSRFGADTEVPSPTFTLVQVYAEDTTMPLWHVDLYRLSDALEAEELGLDEALSHGALLVEWPERWGAGLPEARLDVTLCMAESSARRMISLRGNERWEPVLEALA